VDQLIPSLSCLLDPFAGCFRREVFATFRLAVVAWAVCPGVRTLSEVWQATGLAGLRHHDTFYAFFRSAGWDWDDLGRLLILGAVASLVPTGSVWVVVDDTLCHKRGTHVFCGGFFLDAVTSSRKRKNFRFGLNWVVLGLSVHLPFRPDRYFCLPVLWRVYKKKGVAGYQARGELAIRMARVVAGWLPGRDCWVVADSAYINATLLAGRPANLHVLGPLRWDAALYALPGPRRPGQKGPTPKRGPRLPTPKAMIEDTGGYPAELVEVQLLQRKRRLRVQVVREVLWYRRKATPPVTLVLVRDPSGQWRDEVLLSSNTKVTAQEAVAGYCRRWGIEVAFQESKQHLGLHDPRVRAPRSVERAHPMAWLVQTLTVLWYAQAGKDGPQPRRPRPWYKKEVGPTFTDMLGALRLQLWRNKLLGESLHPEVCSDRLDSLIHWLAAVR
jgi:hypothetical protein